MYKREDHTHYLGKILPIVYGPMLQNKGKYSTKFHIIPTYRKSTHCKQTNKKLQIKEEYYISKVSREQDYSIVSEDVNLLFP